MEVAGHVSGLNEMMSKMPSTITTHQLIWALQHARQGGQFRIIKTASLKIEAYIIGKKLKLKHTWPSGSRKCWSTLLTLSEMVAKKTPVSVSSLTVRPEREEPIVNSLKCTYYMQGTELVHW